MQVEGSGASVSPSFNSYSSEKLAEIAARVIEEIRRDTDSDDALFSDSWEENVYGNCSTGVREDVEEDEDEFEFAFVTREPDPSPISADEIFYNGQIRPIYPIFDQSLLDGEDGIVSHPNGDVGSAVVSRTIASKETVSVHEHRLPLRKLMFGEQDTESFSSSTSETDDNDLDGVPSGTYCVWNPKSVAEGSPRRSCKKSHSTGSSSKRWKLRDLLLLRSHSDGKDSLVVMTPSKAAKAKPTTCNNKVADSNDHERHYDVTNSTMNVTKEDYKAKSRPFLPHKQDLVGFFNNVNGITKNLHPF
ncbi:DUF1645 family protein [Quillaja saponaria]|uniref:DUF1645 family protein n=1 Tax=Quillaja saponaria TaxID=32244 RepID=A0AAD7P8Q0_QUISA|nr:DUF1645 family protein [Quillaja saponaria]